MKKLLIKIISLILPIAFTLTATAFADGVFATSSEQLQLPEVSAQSFVLADAKTGEVIFAHNENQRMPIASTTKVLTCLVALENADVNDLVTVTSDSCGIEGSSIYLYEGEKFTLLDLLYGLMLESANDAAVCIANHVSGSVEKFSDLMNKKASDLGLVNSHFNNPHGLEDPEHYSTAYDMSRIWCEAMKNDDFRKIVSSKTHKIDLDSKEGYRFLSNHNKLLKTFELCIGGKTGYTKTAGRCLISGAEQDGVELVMVTLNDPDDWTDHENMMQYAFSMYSTVEIADIGDVTHTIAVVGGKQKTLTVKNTEAISLFLRDVSKLRTELRCPRFVYAPLTNVNVPIAKVVYLVDGKEVASLPLYPEATVEKAEKDSFIKRFISIFK